MTSEILLAQNFSTKTNYEDHLLENKILDEEDEPQYENGEVLREFILKNKNNTKDKELDKKSITTIFVPDNEENIYENIGFVKNCLNSYEENSQTSSEPDQSKSDVNIFRSTLSLTIGNTNDKSVKIINKTETSTSPDAVFLPDDDSQSSSEKEEDGSFKSSYAKSLLDSLRKNSTSPNQQSPQSRMSPTSPSANCNITFKAYEKLNKEHFHSPNFQISEKHCSTTLRSANNSSPLSLPGFQLRFQDECSPFRRASVSPSSNHLEMKLTNLTEDMKQKDRELDHMRRELMSLQLDYSRLKSENRNLKLTQRSFYDSQPNSLTSISVDSDTWTLQQQVVSLNSQLEKAELSRHAYESATKQLVHFLETIKSTLTVSESTTRSDVPPLPPPITSPLNTSELISNLEKTLATNKIKNNKPRHWFDSNRNGSYLSDTEPTANPRRRRRRSVDPVSSSSASSSASSKKKEKKKSSSSKPVLREEVSPKKLLRSGSVNDIASTNHVSNIPRVTRAVSSTCVDRIAAVEQSTPVPVASNRLSKAKSFFSSLKNIFKADATTSPTDPRPSEMRKKLTLPLKNRHNVLKKSHSLKKDDHLVARKEPHHDHVVARGDHNSVFYLPCNIAEREDMELPRNLVEGDSGDSAMGSDGALSDKDSTGDHNKTTEEDIIDVVGDSKTTEDNHDEMSGPQELSIGLSAHDSGYVTSDETIVTRF